jgi:hypothetical protein
MYTIRFIAFPSAPRVVNATYIIKLNPSTFLLN